MTAGEFETFSLAQVCEMTGAPSPDWLYRRIVSGELTAVLSGREWRMTRSDMCHLVDRMRVAAEQQLAKRTARTTESGTTAPANRAGLSKRGAARMARKRAAA
ncbi:helix-turn-helix domain-containing protein [Nocardia cyriacigeorgica]|uniref:helix-turn-helix domain-containing protein n=1 Tax=Nocardia cyriacigeorgica TaxID=135487 RepID=UPI0013D009D2|nr:helix-turn-helix domain-containing protein [Nocardia cyriacigeorgica]NEW27283.1 helix-turn-helix domain-containing protein [Nocardia cyriacigeorgica]